MSEWNERFQDLFDELRGVRTPAPFAAPELVRRRGRRRARRRGAGLGVAVLAVLGLGSGAVAAVIPPDDPPPPPVAASGPPPTPTASASVPVEIPDTWLLSSEDLGPGWEEVTSHELFDTDPPWYWAGLCGRFRAADYPSLASRQELTVASWRDDTGAGRIDQVVELFAEPAAASANLGEVRAVVGSCGQVPVPGDTEAPVDLAVVEASFLGEESLLVEKRHYYFDGDEIVGQPLVQPVSVVRVGAAVITIIYAGEGDILKEVTQAVVKRLS